MERQRAIGGSRHPGTARRVGRAMVLTSVLVGMPEALVLVMQRRLLLQIQAWFMIQLPTNITHSCVVSDVVLLCKRQPALAVLITPMPAIPQKLLN